MINVTIFRDFVEDNRTSMEVYSDHLFRGLCNNKSPFLSVRDYRPTISKLGFYLPDKFNLKMRFARYISYPLQIKNITSDIYHIIEDGYAHLIKRLDPSRTIVTVNDIIPLLGWKNIIPGLTYPHRPFLYEYSLKYLNKMAHIITISNSTKQDLIKYCGCKDDKITVIYHGLGDGFFCADKEQKVAFRKRFGLPSINTHLVLITGKEQYKNHITSLRVIEKIQKYCSKPICLVRLGKNYKEWDDYLSLIKLKPAAVQIDYLPHDEMIRLYSCVDCLLFPSWYEGFGRPPLEAMACGIPVITSNIASLSEFVNGAGLMAAPDDLDGLADAVYSVLENRELRDALIIKGLKVSSKFTWEQNVSNTVDVYLRVLKEA